MAATSTTEIMRQLFETDRRIFKSVASASSTIPCDSWNVFTHPENGNIYLVLWGGVEGDRTAAIMMLSRANMKRIINDFGLNRKISLKGRAR